MTLSPDSYTKHINTWRTTQSQRKECKAAVQCVGTDQTTWMSNFGREACLTGLWLVSEHSDTLLEKRTGCQSLEEQSVLQAHNCFTHQLADLHLWTGLLVETGISCRLRVGSAFFLLNGFRNSWVVSRPVTKAAYFHRVTVCSMYID